MKKIIRKNITKFKIRTLPRIIRFFYKRRIDEKIQERISNSKIVHIMHHDKFSKPFVDLLNRNFDKNDHLILCQKVQDEASAPFPVGENVMNYNDIHLIDLSSPKIEKIICHSLFSAGIVSKLYKENFLLKKAYWVIWSGDLYSARRNKQNDYVRKHFKGYWGDIDKDYAIAKYHMEGRFLKMFYNFPISKTMLDIASMEKKRKCVRIQINNSCDESTLEVLDMLSKFSGENIEITTILSYWKFTFKNDIIAKGKKLFGDKFSFLDIMLPPEKYAAFLAQNDILILNQPVQRGVGNTLASVYLGTKVFIHEESSTYSYFNKDGIKIFSTQSIKDMNFDEFKSYPEKNISQNNVKKYFDESYLCSLLKDCFNDK